MADSILQYLRAFRSTVPLYNEPAFALGMLKIMEDDTTMLVFDLLANSTHLSNLENSPSTRDALQTLLQMDLLEKKSRVISLRHNFREALLTAFCSPSFSSYFTEFSPPPGYDSSSPAEASELSNYQFNSLLQSIVNHESRQLPYVKDILLYCNLIDGLNEITNKGFEFLLMPRRDQAWFLITNSIKFFAQNQREETEMLCAMMEICLKRRISLHTATHSCAWHSFLYSMGIFSGVEGGPPFAGDVNPGVMGSRGNECPSRPFLINNKLLFDRTGMVRGRSTKYIVVETNYKIYAYTDSLYEKSILSLFCRILHPLPNIIKAQLDEESVCVAFSKGITGKQILRYLSEFSEHVPPSIANQVLIWEANQYRIKETNGILFCDFLHLSDYFKLLKFLADRNAVLLADESRRMIVGSTETYDEAKEFIKGL